MMLMLQMKMPGNFGKYTFSSLQMTPTYRARESVQANRLAYLNRLVDQDRATRRATRSSYAHQYMQETDYDTEITQVETKRP